MDDVPPPRVPRFSLTLPSDPARGRLLFFVAGFGIALVMGGAAIAVLPVACTGGDLGSDWRVWALMVPPWAGFGLVFVQRIRRGAAWHWMPYMFGLMTAWFVIPLLLLLLLKT